MIYEQTDNFFTQKIYLENIEQSRFEFLSYLCKDKKVLHVGCADSMFFSADNNAHIYLSKSAKEIHGFDIDEEATRHLKDICPGIYYTNYIDIKEQYDIVIIPEVLEHILNVKEFLDRMITINSKEIFISVPNILHYSKEMIQEDDYAVEIVHPDHKYWFSPYTLYNIISLYLDIYNDSKMFYLERKSMVGILLKKAQK